MCAVSFFFILSGFLTAYKYKNNSDVNRKNLYLYFINKIKKLYPLYFFLTLISISLYNFPSMFNQSNYGALLTSFFQLVKNLLLIQAWFPSGYFSYIGVGWFLSALLFLSIFSFPVIKLFKGILNNKRYYFLRFFILLLILILLEIAYSYSMRNYDLSYYNYVFPFSRIFEYFIGILVGILYDKLSSKNGNTILFTLLEVFSIFLVGISLVLPNNVFWMNNISKWILPNVILIYVFSLENGYLSKIFKNKILINLGNISYEFFLLHAVVLINYFRLYGSNGFVADVFSIIYIFSITLILSMIIHRTFSQKINWY